MAQCIALLQCSEAKIDFMQVIKHRLTKEWLSVFNINAEMIKAQKGKNAEKLKFVSLNQFDNCTALVDMGLLYKLATPSTKDREKSDETQFLPPKCTLDHLLQ